jgi:hypothetical protein
MDSTAEQTMVMSDQLTMLAAHFLERLDTMNRILSNIEESLRGLEQRLSYATVLDSSD